MAKTVAQIGTGQRSTTAPTSIPGPGSESSKGLAKDSQKTTTAPSVKQPALTQVFTAKPRTARERMVDAYNAGNPAHSGGNQYETALEQQYARIAAAEKQAGTEQKTIKRAKQAQ